MERKLKSEVAEKYQLKKILPGEIVIGARVYDFRTMNLKQADEFYAQHKEKGFLVLKEVLPERLIPSIPDEKVIEEIIPETFLDNAASEVVTDAVSEVNNSEHAAEHVITNPAAEHAVTNPAAEVTDSNLIPPAVEDDKENITGHPKRYRRRRRN